MAGSISTPLTRDGGTEQDELRRRVLIAGRELGWSPDSVARFAEALTGKKWDECGADELTEVLGEYDDLLAAVQRKLERRVRRGASARAPSGVRRRRWA